MKQQGVHPDEAAGTSEAASRPDAADRPGRRPRTHRQAADREDSRPRRTRTGRPDGRPDDAADPRRGSPTTPHRRGRGRRTAAPRARAPPLRPDAAAASASSRSPSCSPIAAFAHGTTSGLEQDINKGTGQAPDLLIKIAGLASSIAILLVPVAFAIERLIKRDGLRIADGVLAAVLAHGVTLATDLWVARAAPDSIQEALTQPSPGDIRALTDPVHGYLAPVIAYMTAVGMSRRPRWRVVLWVVLLLDAFSMLVTGYTTPFSIILTVLIGWTVAYGTLYAVGSPNVRPTGQTLMAGLRHVGFRPVSACRAEEVPRRPRSTATAAAATSSPWRTARRWTSRSSTASSRRRASSTACGAG